MNSVLADPNPPGNIGIQKQATSSIELQWGQAPHMEHAFNYSYKLTYNYSQNEIPSNKTNYILSQLLSGTSYNISVTTVGPMYFESKSVYKYVTTSKNLTLFIINLLYQLLSQCLVKQILSKNCCNHKLQCISFYATDQHSAAQDLNLYLPPFIPN